jgi:excisionase family DNA binding protein
MELYTTAEAAEKLKVTVKTVEKYLALGQLKAHRLGPNGSLRFTEADLESILTKYERK